MTGTDSRRRGGALVISLDFELYWGGYGVVPLDAYRANLLGVRTAVPAMLDAFARHGVHATWAAVGFLMFESRDALLAALPRVLPQYHDATLSPYPHLATLGADEREDPFHFAPSLIRQIRSSPGQEVASHTFSHYYCLEPGHTPEAFRADLAAAIRTAAQAGQAPRSIVFPRNHVDAGCLAECHRQGITAYRGRPQSRLDSPAGGGFRSAALRALRLLDAYVSISGPNDFAITAEPGVPVDVRASRFVRPYAPALRLFEPLRLRRITSSMTHAAQHGLVYHIWWHPHNFGANIAQNIAFLDRILAHYARLRSTYGMESLNMAEAADRACSDG